MPHRRRIKKNSFGGHFDELVKHFPEQASKLKMTNERVPKEEGNVHDRLFERSWRNGGARRPEG